MNIETNSIEQELIGLAHSAIAAGKNAADFVMEQAPQLAREVITYNMALHGAYLGGGLICFMAIALVWWVSREVKDKDDKAMIRGFTSVVLALIGGGVWVDHLSPFLKAWLAPRMFLLEYITELLK